jgi:hypothetical protein
VFDIDRLEIADHRFDQINLEKFADFYVCRMVVDGTKVKWIEPAANLWEFNYGSPEFENYLKAQALGAPIDRGAYG